MSQDKNGIDTAKSVSRLVYQQVLNTRVVQCEQHVSEILV